jgi:hypothetical protein
VAFRLFDGGPLFEAEDDESSFVAEKTYRHGEAGAIALEDGQLGAALKTFGGEVGQAIGPNLPLEANRFSNFG